jgi:hypothetical protein
MKRDSALHHHDFAITIDVAIAVALARVKADAQPRKMVRLSEDEQLFTAGLDSADSRF